MIYGYARVSAKDQCEERQLFELDRIGVLRKNIYIDKQSGKDFLRKNYRRLRKKLKQGDVLVVKSIDRLGRNYSEIQEEWRYLTKKVGADIKIIDMPLLDTTANKDLMGTLISDIVLQLLSYVAQTERENILQRQSEGIAAAKRRGVRFGRPEIKLPDTFDIYSAKWKNGEITAREASEKLNMNLRTFYRKSNNN